MNLSLLLLFMLTTSKDQLLVTAADFPFETAPGVLLETIEEGSALNKAGLHPGDIVFAWSKGFTPEDASDFARQEINSLFDWLWLDAEQSPRGSIRLWILREGKAQSFLIGPGSWWATTRPLLTKHGEAHLAQAQAMRQTNQGHETARRWEYLSNEAIAQGRIFWATWAKVMQAQAWLELGDHESSQRSFDSAIAIASKSGDTEPKLYAWLSMADFLTALEDPNAASRAYEAALQLLKDLPEEHRLLAARIQGRIAAAHLMMNEFEKAHELAQPALLAYSELAPESSQFAGLLNLDASILDNLGYPTEAAQLHKKSLAIAENNRDSYFRVANLNNLGTIAYSRGDLIEASAYFERALAALNEEPSRAIDLSHVLNNLGSLYLAQGKFDEAEVYSRRGLDLVKSNSVDRSRLLLNLGYAALNKGQLDEAERFCRESLNQRERISKEGPLTASPLNCLSVVNLEQGDPNKAWDYAQRALNRIEIEAPESIQTADRLLQLSKISFARGDLETSKTLAQRAQLLYSRLAPHSEYHAESLHRMALVHASTGHHEEAQKWFERAVLTLESQLTKAYESQVDRGYHRSRRRDIYLNYVQELVATGQLEKAFDLLERWRAGAFLAMLAERDLIFSEIPPELDRKRRLIVREYDQVLQGIILAQDTKELMPLRDRLTSLRALHQEVEQEIRSSSPRLSALTYPEALDFKAARESLETGTVMLSYAVYPDHTTLFVLAPHESLHVLRLNAGETELRRDITALLQAIPDIQPALAPLRLNFVKVVSSRLYQDLLAPARHYIEGASRLVILPDGPLHTLPWGLLTLTSVADAEPFQKAEHTATPKPVHIVLSATVYSELRRNRSIFALSVGEQNPSHVAAFGDPIYTKAQTYSTPKNTEQVKINHLTRSGLSLESLPTSRREVEGIMTLFPGATRLYLGNAATEENVKNLPKSTRIVHLAVHSIVDSQFPLNSAVVLTLPETFENTENGLLQAWEIFERVRIEADLIVLSACESGLGKEMGGEGLIGLTRAFQYAGARSVMASLWKISDRTTAEFMVRFYRHLKEGLPKDEALRATQMEFIRGPIQVTNDKGERVNFDASAPYYWAAFQIYGDWQ